jgi:nitrogen fixation protein FixH
MKSITKWSWGVRIAIVYTTFAVGTLAWVGFAMSKSVDLVRPDYYEYSLEHDQVMRQEQNAKALGNAANITVDNESIVIQLPTTAAISEGSVQLYRPNSVEQDRHYELKLDPTGIMRIPYKAFVPGQWEVSVQWVADGTTYLLKKRAMF